MTSVDFDEVSAEDVSRHFGRRRAVSRMTFRASRGMIMGLLGPNGAGKSTLLAMLATVLRPSSGTIRYGTLEPPVGPALRARIGVLGHDLFLYPELTARENLSFFAGLYGIADGDARARAALERAGLDTRRDDPVANFSRGMRQRVALERALIHDPRLALLDEPFTGLDDASTEALLRRLKGLRDSGAIVILATHDLDLAEGLLDRTLFLREGKIVETTTTQSGLRSTYRSVIGRKAEDERRRPGDPTSHAG